MSSLIRNTLAHYYSVIPYPQHSGPLVSSLIRSTLAHFCHPLSATLWPTFVIPYPQHFGPPLSSLIGNTLAHHCHPLSATLWPIIGNTLAHHCHPLFAASCPNITILYTVRNGKERKDRSAYGEHDLCFCRKANCLFYLLSVARSYPQYSGPPLSSFNLPHSGPPWPYFIRNPPHSVAPFPSLAYPFSS